ncbi:MAG: ParA family protein [Actinobacteria bacterium]|nr:ParA family protein [Actinomycetota bacterium]
MNGTVTAAWEDRAAGDGAETDPVDMSHDPRGDAPAGQTAPAEPSHSEAPGPMDGSAGMDERAGDGGVLVAGAAPSGPQEQMSEYGHMTTTGSTPVRVGYEEHERVDLVRSLPSVDDSTPLAVEVAEDARRRITLSGRPFPKPPHTRIMTVANQKGGVGKTTTTVNMAAALAQAGLNVLVLDIDPQGNASTALGIDHHSDIPSLYDVVVEGMPLADVVQPCPDVPNLWCAPATIDLAGAEIELVSLVARETRLQRALATYLDERINAGLPNIDYVFVDCPPSLSLLTVNAFVAAREVLIPIQCEYYALEGLSQLLKHVELIRGHLNPELHVSTILLTMYDGRTRLSSQVADEVREHFPEQVVKTSVPRSVRISEAPSHGQTVMTYDPASSGALSYLEAARELAEQVLTWNDRPTTTEERV